MPHMRTTASGIFPVFKPVRELTVLDARPYSWEEQFTLVCLQGLVNRKEPRIFLVFNDHDDRKWLEIYRKTYGIRTREAKDVDRPARAVRGRGEGLRALPRGDDPHDERGPDVGLGARRAAGHAAHRRGRSGLGRAGARGPARPVHGPDRRLRVGVREPPARVQSPHRGQLLHRGLVPGQGSQVPPAHQGLPVRGEGLHRRSLQHEARPARVRAVRPDPRGPCRATGCCWAGTAASAARASTWPRAPGTGSSCSATCARPTTPCTRASRPTTGSARAHDREVLGEGRGQGLRHVHPLRRRRDLGQEQLLRPQLARQPARHVQVQLGGAALRHRHRPGAARVLLPHPQRQRLLRARPLGRRLHRPDHQPARWTRTSPRRGRTAGSATSRPASS